MSAIFGSESSARTTINNASGSNITGNGVQVTGNGNNSPVILPGGANIGAKATVDSVVYNVSKNGVLTINPTPDNSALLSAIGSVGNALQSATNNRDVISQTPAGNTTVTPLSGAAPAGGWAAIPNFLTSNTFKIIIIAAFPLAALALWLMFGRKKHA
jgi:hypothetical protein